MGRVAGFAADTAVERLDERRFAGHLTDRWLVLGDAAPNGGYLMAVAARAMAAAGDRPDPVTVSAHYVRPTHPGDVEIHTEVVKVGRRHSTVAARLLQQGRECTRLLGTFGDLTAADGPTRIDREPPQLPPVDECPDMNAAIEGEEGGFAPPVFQRFDHRMPPGMMDWTRGQPLGRGLIQGWCRFAGDEPMDPFGLLVVADAYPPAIFNAGEPVGWTPTVEMTVQIRKRPAPGWLATRFTSDLMTRGYLEEDGEVWDADGDVVALSRQLALVARPS